MFCVTDFYIEIYCVFYYFGDWEFHYRCGFVEFFPLLHHFLHNKVSSEERQEAKGIVYGVIYGMGIKTLAQQMEVNLMLQIFSILYPHGQYFNR